MGARRRRQRTVLFLLADTGAGHRSAANAIVAAMRAADEPDWRPVLVDGIRECGRFPFRDGVFLYGPTTKYRPQLFGRFFHLTNTPERVAAARRLCLPFLGPGLRDLIARVRPDAIISVHPMFNQAVPPVLRELSAPIPLVGVITDLFTIHHAWVAPGVDAWVAPSEVARRFLLDSGVCDQRIHLLGLPIDPAFAVAPTCSRAQRRAALGLDPTLPVVLLMGGGEGVGGLGAVAHTLAREAPPAQVVIVTGRNQALYDDLARRHAAFQMPTMVLGFADNMPELMRAADVLVSKAGSLTLSEALACELPIVLMGALPGQEEGNIDFVVRREVGVFAPTPHEVAQHLRSLLAPGEKTLARMRANARRLSRPTAAAEVARLVFAQLPPAAAPAARVHALHQPSRCATTHHARRLGGNARLGATQRRTHVASWYVDSRPHWRHGTSLARLMGARALRRRHHLKGTPRGTGQTIQLRRTGRH
jgi:1,2-diacylglycerol 3-beta-galactosyltransferase